MGMCTSLTKNPMKPMIEKPTPTAFAIAKNSLRSGLVHFFTKCIESLANWRRGSMATSLKPSFSPMIESSKVMINTRERNFWLFTLELFLKNETYKVFLAQCDCRNATATLNHVISKYSISIRHSYQASLRMQTYPRTSYFNSCYRAAAQTPMRSQTQLNRSSNNWNHAMYGVNRKPHWETIFHE